VLIAAAAASANPIDWKVRSGAWQRNFQLTFPAILGRDVSGVVRAIGAHVRHFRPGDRRRRPDLSKVREFADDLRDGKFDLPLGRRLAMRDAAEAYVLGEKGGIGKILLLPPDPPQA
jgi:NADPH:quinone reductase-like Zn-dependent oxidoreductase